MKSDNKRFNNSNGGWGQIFVLNMTENICREINQQAMMGKEKNIASLQTGEEATE